MKISIVILTRNRLDSLKRCINSIIENTVNTYEIIVVNNDSNDGTKEYLNTSPKIVSVSLDKNYGVAARNYGIKIAKAQFIAQIDDDVTVFKNWDETMLQYFDNDSTIAVGPCATNISGWIQWNNHGIKDGDYVDNLTGYCWMFRNKGFLYDDFFTGKSWHDETELQLQMMSNGYKFRVCKPVCNHISLRKGINWEEHNECQDHLIKKWKSKWEEGKFELIGIKREEK